MRIAVSGLGSLGLVIGGILQDTGYDVTLIDSPAGNNTEIINSNGIKVLGYKDEFISCRCILPQDAKETFDVVFSLTKQLQLEDSLKDLKGCIGDTTIVVTCQNGIPEDEAIKVLPQKNVIGCSIAWGATRIKPGISQITTPPEKMDMVIGELDGEITERLNIISNLLKSIGKTEITINIKGIKWTKLIMNSNFMGPCGVLGCTLGEVLLDKSLVKYVPYIALEGTKIYKALGMPLETLQSFTPDVELLNFNSQKEREKIINDIIYKVWLKLKDIKPSMVQDLEKGRKTEIDYINGKIVEEGNRLNIPTPVNSFFVNTIKRIESGEFKPSMENRSLLNELEIQ
ncbi:MAG: ketopantoate reductase family protein [Eubacteriales bacterium]